MTRYIYGMTVVMLALLAGCKKEEPTPPAVEPPPPKSTAEIYGDYKAALQPLFSAASPNSAFGHGMKTPIISQFKSARSQYSSEREINEPEARTQIEKDVSNYIKAAKKAEQWFAVDALLDVYKILRPDSQVYTTLRTRSDLMMARPIVACTGFATIGDEDLLSFLDVMDPKTRQVETFRVREGEAFYPDAEGKSLLRLVRVIGAQSAIEMEYLALPGETWEIPGPKND